MFQSVLLNLLSFSLVFCSYLDLSLINTLKSTDKKRGIQYISNNFETDSQDTSSSDNYWPIGLKKESPVRTTDSNSLPGPVSIQSIPLLLLKPEEKDFEKEAPLKEKLKRVPYHISEIDLDDPVTFDSTSLSMPISNYQGSPCIEFSKNTSHAEIITKEVTFCGFKKERRALYQLILDFFAQDNVEGLKMIEDQFNDTFKIKNFNIGYFSKGGFDGYLIRYLFLFGSVNIIKEFRIITQFNRDNFYINFDAIKYLIETKPIEVVLSVLQSLKLHIYSMNYGLGIWELLKRKYPNFSPFQRRALEIYFSSTYELSSLSTGVLRFGSDQEILEAILSKINSIFTCYTDSKIIHLIDLIFENEDLITQCSPVAKQNLAAILMGGDNIERLKRLVEIHQGDFSFIHNSYKECRFSVIEISIRYGAKDCFKYLFESRNQGLVKFNADHSSLLEAVLNHRPEYIDILIPYGFDLETEITYGCYENFVHVMKTLKAAQFVFLKRMSHALDVLIEKFGKEAIVNSILAIWSDKSDQLNLCMGANYDYEWMLKFCEDNLGLDFKGNFIYEGKSMKVDRFAKSALDPMARRNLFKYLENRGIIKAKDPVNPKRNN